MMYFGKHRNKKMDAIFRALSDPTRREILRLLQTGDLAAGELSDHFPVAKSTFSGHLKVLKEAGLVVTERQGTTIVYSLNTGAHEDLLRVVFDLMQIGGGRPSQGEVHDADMAN
jgi:DNA-binding transcriptional ArsR family regulator